MPDPIQNNSIMQALAKMLLQSAQPSSTYTDKPYIAQMQQQRQQNAFEQAKQEDYYNKVRELNGLRAQGTNPSQMFQKANNFVGDYVTGNNNQQMLENLALLAIPMEKLLAPLVKKGVGRVMTNLVEPYSYDTYSHLQTIKERPIKDLVKSVVKDEPIYKTNFNNLENGWENPAGREVPYRKMFGLEPRGRSSELYTTNPDGSIAFAEKNNFLNQDLNANVRYIRGGGETPSHTIMGAFNLDQVGNTNQYNYYDKWDFALNNGESPFYKGKIDRQNMVRFLLDKIATPVEIKGTFNYKP